MHNPRGDSPGQKPCAWKEMYWPKLACWLSRLLCTPIRIINYPAAWKIVFFFFMFLSVYVFLSKQVRERRITAKMAQLLPAAAQQSRFVVFLAGRQELAKVGGWSASLDLSLLAQKFRIWAREWARVAQLFEEDTISNLPRSCKDGSGILHFISWKISPHNVIIRDFVLGDNLAGHSVNVLRFPVDNLPTSWTASNCSPWNFHRCPWIFIETRLVDAAPKTSSHRMPQRPLARQPSVFLIEISDPWWSYYSELKISWNANTWCRCYWGVSDWELRSLSWQPGTNHINLGHWLSPTLSSPPFS